MPRITETTEPLEVLLTVPRQNQRNHERPRARPAAVARKNPPNPAASQNP